MKSRNATWEVIVAGCLFMAIGVYLIHPPDLSTTTPETDKRHKTVVKPRPPQAPSAVKSLAIELEKLESLERLEELEQLKKELKKLEKELKNHSFQPGMLSLPSLKKIPGIQTYSFSFTF